MKLATVLLALVLAAATAGAARRNGPYKNKRIIKIRVPPRQHLDFGVPGGYTRGNGPPFRYKEFPFNQHEFYRPTHPHHHNNAVAFYAKHKSRPPPQALSGVKFSGLPQNQSLKKHVKDFHQKFSLTYGSNFPHKNLVSSFKFPSLKEEIHVAHIPSVGSPAVQIPKPLSAPLSPTFPSSSYSSVYQPTSHYEPSSHAHVQSSESDRGPIREIPAPNLGPKPIEQVPQGDDFATYGKGPSIDVTHLVEDNGGQITFPATEYYLAFGEQPQNLDNLESDNHLSTSSYYGSVLYKDNHASSNFEDIFKSTKSTENAHKSKNVTPSPSPSRGKGYEVTENQQSENGNDGSSSSQYFYAPSPDPSLPVHKVPSVKAPGTEEKKFAENFVPQSTQNFQILEGGTVAAPLNTLSTEELYRLMHGYSEHIVSQGLGAEPVVTILGQPQSVILQPSYTYIPSGNDHIAETGASAIGQYVPQVDSYQKHGSQQAILQQQQQQIGAYKPDQYQSYNLYAPDEISAAQSYQSGDAGGFSYEPDASESEKLDSVLRIDEEIKRQANSGEKSDVSTDDGTLIHFSKLPEVPFYATLPNKKAAEALASLQAAGSIASNYVDRLKTMEEEKKAAAESQEPESSTYAKLRGDQGEEIQDDDDLRVDISNLGLPQEELLKPQKVVLDEVENLSGQNQESSGVKVDVQKSIPLYETSYPTSLTESPVISQPAGNSASAKSGIFGQRIRPKK